MQEPPAALPDTASFSNTGHGTGAGKETQLHTGEVYIPEAGVTGLTRSSRLVQEGLRPCTLQATPSSQRASTSKLEGGVLGYRPFLLSFSMFKILVKNLSVCIHVHVYVCACMHICI